MENVSKTLAHYFSNIKKLYLSGCSFSPEYKYFSVFHVCSPIVEAILKYMLSDPQLHFSVLPQFWDGIHLVIMSNSYMFSSLRSFFPCATVFLGFFVNIHFYLPCCYLQGQHHALLKTEEIYFVIIHYYYSFYLLSTSLQCLLAITKWRLNICTTQGHL